MKDILIYTFRTFPYIEKLKSKFDDIIVLDKLKRDIDFLCTKIVEVNYKSILGIAKSTKNNSCFEPLTINQFHKGKKVVNGGIENFMLYVPNLDGTNFQISRVPTDSFCNYSMYKIKHFIDKNILKTRFSFAHIIKPDIKFLKKVFTDGV